MGFFPIDDRTLDYLRLTSRTAEEIDLVERYCKEQGLFRTDDSPDPQYTDVLELDLGTIEPCLAGPKRPQDRIALSHMQPSFDDALRAPLRLRGFELTDADLKRTADVQIDGTKCTLKHGSVVIAAITSCTNTSNPSVMIGAGLLAKKAVEKGINVKPWGQDLARARLARRDRILRQSRPDAVPGIGSASTTSAMAARPASATAGRCPSRSAPASSRPTWLPARS